MPRVARLMRWHPAIRLFLIALYVALPAVPLALSQVPAPPFIEFAVSLLPFQLAAVSRSVTMRNTRFFAAAAAIEMLIITALYWNNGFAWLNRGYEYVLMWGLVCFAIALRGGGDYSLDRAIGREL